MVTLLGPNAGGGQPTSYEPMNAMLTAGAAGAMTANTIYLLKGRLFVPKKLTAITLDVVTNVSGNIDAGWYLSDGTNYQRQDQAGSTAVGASTTLQTLAMLLSVPVPADVDFWLALHCSVNPTIGRVAGGARENGHNAKCVSIAVTFATAPGLPSSISIAGTAGTAFAPWLAATLV